MFDYHKNVLAYLPDAYSYANICWHIHNYNGDGTYNEPDDAKFNTELTDMIAFRTKENMMHRQVILNTLPIFSKHDDAFMLKSLDWLDEHNVVLTGNHSTDELRLEVLLNSGTHGQED